MPPPLLVLSLVALLPLALSLAPNSPSFLIVQNSGGGHGSIGYHLAKRLAKVGPVTFLQDSACDKSKEPFASYNNLEIDVDIQYLDFKTDLPSLPQFDVVIDNFSKNPTDKFTKNLISAAKKNKSAYLYVSSAGVYSPPPTHGMEGSGPLEETMNVKAAGQVLVERELLFSKELTDRSYSFRPQYIYGEKSSKNAYLDYFFDRISRSSPLPIPSPGTQLVSLTNSADIASLLTHVASTASGKNTMRGPVPPAGIYNAGTKKLYSYNEVAEMCGAACNIKPNIVYFEPVEADPVLGKFPFRANSFYITPDSAMTELGWHGGDRMLENDLGDYWKNYLERGRGLEELEMDFSDDADLFV